MGVLVIAGVGLVHLVLGVVMLATGYRVLRRELIPRLIEARPGPLNAFLTIMGGVGWTVVIAAFCFLVASRTVQMILQ